MGTERKFVFRQVFSKSLTHRYTREWLKWQKRRVKAAHTVRQSVCLHQNRQTYPSILPRAAPAFLASPRRSRAHIRLLPQRTSTQQRMIRPRLSAPTLFANGATTLLALPHSFLGATRSHHGRYRDASKAVNRMS